ncbi:MAG: transposase [Cyclobacteriaceae bacterium]|nr:transposase [Cyclobacteriaceae bacterium]
MVAHIDFEFFVGLWKTIKKETQGENRGGRPAYDYVMMFKIVILQRYYSLSDDSKP